MRNKDFNRNQAELRVGATVDWAYLLKVAWEPSADPLANPFNYLSRLEYEWFTREVREPPEAEYFYCWEIEGRWARTSSLPSRCRHLGLA